MAKTCVIVMIVFLIGIIFYEKTEIFDEKTEIFSIKIKIYQTDEEIKRYICLYSVFLDKPVSL